MYLFEEDFEIDDFFDDDFDFVEEAYYGKTSGLKKAEKLLVPIIKYCHDIYDGSFEGNISDTKEVKELEKVLADEFGIGELSMTFYTVSVVAGQMPNAFTYPSSLQFFKKSKENKKIANKKNSFVGVNVDIALVVSLDLTPDELMACILHEIGHCMNTSVFTLLAQLPSIQLINIFTSDDVPDYVKAQLASIIAIRTFLPIGKILHNIDKKLNELMSRVPKINSIIKTIMAAVNDVTLVFAPFESIINIIKNPLGTIMRYIDPHSIFAYQGERFSDSFATSYGYGVGLSSFMYKLQNMSETAKEVSALIPVLGIGRDLAEVSVKIVRMLADPHPSNPARIINQLNKMKRDLKDPNLDPRVRKELLENIESLENIVNNEILNMENYKTDETGISPVKFYYNYVIMKVFNGKLDPRELLNIGNHYEL